MDDVTRPEDLQRDEPAPEPGRPARPDFRPHERGGPDTAGTKPVEQAGGRGEKRRRARRPGTARRADREPSALGGQQQPGDKPIAG